MCDTSQSHESKVVNGLVLVRVHGGLGTGTEAIKEKVGSDPEQFQNRFLDSRIET